MKMSDLEKYIFAIFGLGFFYKIAKNLFKYIIRLNKEKNLMEFKSELSAETFKNMQKNLETNKEIDEKIDNMSDTELNKLM